MISLIKKSLSKASESNNKFTYFYDPIFEDPIKIYFSESAFKWLHEYKSKDQIEKILKFKSENNITYNSNIFFIIYYCYAFVIPDLIYLKKLVLRAPHQNLKTLNIGAGLAFHDIFLSQMTKNIKSFNIIEKSALNYADEIYPTIKENNILDVYELSKQNILDNNLSALFSFFNEINFNNMNKKFDLIYSFRSWCFKYEVDVYLDFVLNNLNNNGVLLIDVRNDFEKKELMNNFKKNLILAEGGKHKRYMFIK